MTSTRPLMSRLCAGLLSALIALPIVAGTMDCQDTGVSVTGPDNEVIAHTCQAVTRAQDRLAQCGIALTRPIEIHVLDRVRGTIGDCLALYHCGEDRIDILHPSAMRIARETSSAFAPVSDGAYWDSVIVHEVTHAAFESVRCPFSSCVATSEYASYAMQVWLMPEAEQTLFGSNIDLQTKPTRDAISAMMYYMSPNRFALMAWLHFQAQPDPCAYMQAIMNGEVFFDLEPP